MDEESRAAGPELGAEPAGEERSPEEIRDDIDRTRAELGDTVEALAERTDVKAQAQQRLEELKTRARQRRAHVAAKVRSTTPASAQESGRRVAARVRENPAPAALSGAALAGFLLGRLTGRGRS